MSGYRVFMVIVFACIVLLNLLSDQSPSAPMGTDIVGPVSVIVWVLTLLGGLV